EELLAGIWCELLHLNGVGVHDNFFELGGHSLLATQMISRVRNAFGVELPLQTVFDAPTIEQFAQRVESIRQARPSDALKENGRSSVPVSLSSVRSSSNGEIELSFAQERLWFLEQLEPGLAVYNVPI